MGNVFGYLIALPAAGCNACYLVLAAQAQDRVDNLTHVEMLFFTAFYNIFVFAPLTAPEWGDVKAFFSSQAEFDFGFTVGTLVGYVLLGTFLNFATFWCTAATSPVSTGVTGHFKGMLSTWIGFAYFGSSMTAVGWLGLALSMVGGCMYSLARSAP